MLTCPDYESARQYLGPQVGVGLNEQRQLVPQHRQAQRMRLAVPTGAPARIQQHLIARLASCGCALFALQHGSS